MFGNIPFTLVVIGIIVSGINGTLKNTIGAEMLRKLQCKCSFLKAHANAK